jgi:hypothetical protein
MGLTLWRAAETPFENVSPERVRPLFQRTVRGVVWPVSKIERNEHYRGDFSTSTPFLDGIFR